MWRLLYVFVALAIAAGCGGDVEVAQQQLSIEHTTVTATPATAVADGVSAARILVTARDTEGKAMANQTVSLSLTGERNVLSAESVATNKDGVAEFQLTSTLAEQKRVTATIGEVALAPITTTFIAGPPARFDFLSPPTDTVAGAIINPSVQLRLLDANGNTNSLQSFEVALSLGGNSTGARLRGATTAASVGGTVTFQNLSVDKAGEYTLVASTQGVDGQPSPAFTIRPAAPIKLAFASVPVDPGAGVPLSPALEVEVRDVFENRVETDLEEVKLSIASGPPGRSIAGTLTVPAVGGVARFDDVVLKTSGVYTLDATATGLGRATSEPFTVAPAVPVRVLFKVQPAGSSAGVTLNAMEAIVHDSVGNVVVDYSGEAQIAIATGPTGATLAGSTTIQFDQGTARFNTLSLDKAGEYTLTVTSGALTPAVSNTFRISPSAPKRLAFAVEPSNALAGEAIAPGIRVSIRDDFGNVVTNSSYLVSLNVASGPSGATLSGTRAAAAIGGEAVFTNVRLTRSGDYTLSAIAGTLTSATSAPFTIAPGAPTRLAFTVEPTSITAGQPISPTVQVQAHDAFGNVVPTFTAPVTLAIGSGTGGATLAGTTVVGAAAGVADFPGVSVDKAGDFSLLATAAGLASATSAPFSVGPAAPTRLAFTVQPRDSNAGQTFSPALQVFLQDDFGNTVPTASETVTLAIASGPEGATLLGSTTASSAGGIATFSNLRIERSGTYTLTASAGALTSATTDAFNIRPAPPAKLSFEVEPTAAGAGDPIAPSVRVAIQDSYGNVVDTATNRVALTLSGGTPGAVLTGGSGTNAVAGLATFDNLSLDKTGTYSLVASSGVFAQATSVPFEISAGPADRVVFQVQPADGTAGVTLAPAITLLIQDRFGNLRSSATDEVTLTLLNGPNGGALLGTTTVAASGGVATFDDLSMERAGTYTLTASSGTLRAADTVPFTIAPAAASKLAYRTQPLGTQAGRTLNPVVELEVQDAFSNLVPSSTAPITVALGEAPAGAALQGTATVAASGGVARFPDLSLRATGTYSLVATSGALAQIESSTFAIAHADPHELVITVEPTNAGAGTILAPAIEIAVRDQFGNVATGSNNVVRASLASGPSTAVLSGTTAHSPTQGVVRFDDLSIDTSGQFTLAFAANGLTSDVSSPFTISSGGGARLAFQVEPVDAVAGKPMAPIQVKVQDAFGNDVTDATDTVTLAIGSGPAGATLLGTVTAPAVDGVATFSGLSIQKTGAFRLTASAGGLTSASSASFRIHADAPVGLSLVTQPSNVVAGQPISPAVEIRVLDQYGNLAEQSNDNVVVTIASGPGGATLFGNTNAGPSSGVVTLGNLRLDKVGSYTLTASSGTLTAVTTASFDVTPAAPAQLAWSAQPISAVAGAAISPAVKVELLDAFGNETPTATNAITVAIASGPTGATISGTRTVNAVAGEATFTDLTLDRSGAYSLLATSGGLTSATSAFFNVSAAAATRLAFTVEPSDASAGRQLSPAPQVTVQDQFGNTVASSTHAITLTIKSGPGGATLFGQTTLNANGGVARFSDLSLNRVGSYTLEASAAGLSPITSAAFDIAPGAPAALAFLTHPTDIVAGEPIAPTVQVQVRDAYGNAAPAQVEVTLSFASGPASASLLGPSAVFSSEGTASFPGLSVDRVGGYTLTASAGTLTSATSGSFEVSAAAPSKLAFTVPPSDEIAGEVISPSITLEVRDAFENPVPTADRDVTLSIATQPGGATLAGVTTVASSGGVVAFPTVSLDKAGSYTLRASADGLTQVTSAPFVISPAAKTKLAFLVQPPNAGAGDPLRPGVQVVVQDTFGNTVTSATDDVTLVRATGRSDGTLKGTTTVAAVDGIAIFNDLYFEKRDDYTLAASAPGLSGATSAPFTITWGSLKFLAFATQPLNTVAGEVIAPAIRVEVRDLFGNRNDGATDSITISVASGPPGSIVGGTITRNAVSGVAVFDDLVLQRAGLHRLGAGAGSVNPATSNQFTIQPAAAAKVGFVATPSSATAGQALAPAVQVAIQDQFGNTVTGASDSVTVSVATGVSGATFGGTLTRAASSGIASFNDLTLDLAGPYSLRASSGALTEGTSTQVNVGAAAKAKLAFTVPPSTVRSGDAITPAVEVTVQDQFGNTVLGATDTVTLSLASNPPGGQLTGTNSATASAGVAVFGNVRFNKKGTYSLRANSAGLTGVDSPTFTVDNNVANKLAFSVQPAGGAAGTALASIEVQILDSNDNLVSDATHGVTLSKASGPGTISGTTTVSAVGGIATFTGISFDIAGDYTLSASAGTLTAASSSAFTIGAGEMAKLAILVAPSSGTAGASLSPALQVAIQDAFGNLVDSDDPVEVAVKTGPGTLTGDASVVAVGGVATFGTLRLDKAGSYTLEATSGLLDPATTGTITIAHGAASTLSFAQGPTTAEAGETIAPAVTVRVTDDYDNLATGFSGAVTLTVTGGGATILGTDTVAAASGIATFSDLRITKAGSHTLTASAAGLSSVESGSFTITPADPATYAFATQPVSGTAGAALAAVTVEARDDWGNHVTTAAGTVTLELGLGGPSGATLGGTVNKPMVGGTATFDDLVIEKAGSGFTLLAGDGILAKVESDSFAIAPAAPAALAFGVQPSTSSPGHVIAPAVTVQIRDAFGNLTTANDSVTVALETNPSGAALGGTLTRSATDGVATFDDLTVSLADSGYSLAATSGSLGKATSAMFDVEAFRIGTFTSDKSAYAVSEAATLSWTTTGTPAGGLVLDPVGAAVNGGSTSVTPFPNSSTSTAWYRLAEDGAPYRAELEWVSNLGGGAFAERAMGLAARSDGSSYAVGFYTSDVTFGGTNFSSAGNQDIWIARYNADGTVAWVETAGGTGGDQPYGAAVLSDGSLVMVGACGAAATFDGGQPTAVSLACAGTSDGFIARYGSDGTLAWAKRMGGPSTDVVTTVAAHGTGFVVAGTFRGTARFGAGEEHETDLTAVSASGSDGFVAAFDADGELQWVEGFGGAGSDVLPKGITVLGSDVYVAGTFTSAATFGPGEGAETTLTSAGGTDVFLAKLSATNGLLSWARRAGGTGADTPSALARVSGGVVMVGDFNGTATFGAGEATPTALASAGGIDGFLAAYDTSGSHLFARRMGGITSDSAQSVGVQPDGSLVVSGYFSGAATFGPSEANQTVLSMGGSINLFLASFTPAGLLQWAVGGGGNAFDGARCVATLADGSMLTLGDYSDTATFGPGEPNETTLNSTGQSDIYLMKYTPANYRFLQVTRTP